MRESKSVWVQVGIDLKMRKTNPIQGFNNWIEAIILKNLKTIFTIVDFSHDIFVPKYPP